ncbi:hypothetical protein CEXT_571361 [Caerostris extrusa]|uniref:Uncharacterized protein n=1 Tax=Caerostris extrusa TaxID=172846 RepID=A0AAV4V0G2_CAEEX|nr:hypothetical protein CEXT_571361 [Caerostris extrusa]
MNVCLRSPAQTETEDSERVTRLSPSKNPPSHLGRRESEKIYPFGPTCIKRDFGSAVLSVSVLKKTEQISKGLVERQVYVRMSWRCSCKERIKAMDGGGESHRCLPLGMFVPNSSGTREQR